VKYDMDMDTFRSMDINTGHDGHVNGHGHRHGHGQGHEHEHVHGAQAWP
jgi:hypothetical protein